VCHDVIMNKETKTTNQQTDKETWTFGECLLVHVGLGLASFMLLGGGPAILQEYHPANTGDGCGVLEYRCPNR